MRKHLLETPFLERLLKTVNIQDLSFECGPERGEVAFGIFATSFLPGLWDLGPANEDLIHCLLAKEIVGAAAPLLQTQCLEIVS